MLAHSSLAHPRQKKIDGGEMLGGEKDAGQMTRRLGNGAQGVDPADNLLTQRLAVASGDSRSHQDDPICGALAARCARLACQCCAIWRRVGTQTRSWFAI